MKPPTQGVIVDGIAPKPITMDPKADAIDWLRLGGLPPFEMFIAEKYQGQMPDPSRDLYDDYCQWHAAKGYWPNETPMGMER